MKLLRRVVCMFTFCGVWALGVSGAHAGTNGFLVPLFRGSPNSQAGYWETFTVALGYPGNGADRPGATTGAVLVQANTNAFLTGSGNIYNLNDISVFSLEDSAPFALGTVVLQTRTIGSELDYNSVSLVYSNDSGTHTLAPLYRDELNRASGQGFNVSSLWQWDLSGLGVNAYSISFAAGEASLSFDSMTLDTAAEFSPVYTTQPYRLQSAPATLARWMYPFNANPATRPTASVFGALGSYPDFDSRDAQVLLGWATTNRVPAGLGASNYVIHRARVTLTIASGNQYTYTGTLHDYRSYFPTNDPRYIAPVGPGMPVEMYGAGFRGGFTNTTGNFEAYAATNYPADGPWGVSATGGFHTNRVAFAAGFNTNGVLVDVSNNVADDGTNEFSAPFEVAPFAVGQSTNVAPGQLMPVGSQLTFDLNLNDPFIYSYVQRGLNDGNLSFIVASFVAASLGGPPNYPNFYTPFSSIADPSEYPLLDLDGGIIRPNYDSDADGLPDDWENAYLGSLVSSATNDVDGDSFNNLAEYHAGTIPVAADSALRVLAFSNVSGVSEVHFTVAPARDYFVGWSDSLPVWQTIANPPLTFSSAWLSKTAPNASYPSPVYAVWRETNSTSAIRFYQVGTQ